MLGVLLWLLQASPNLAILPDASTLLHQVSVVGFVRMAIESGSFLTVVAASFVDPIELFKGTLARDVPMNRPSLIYAD